MAKRTRAFKSQKIYNTDTELSCSDEDWIRIFGKSEEDYISRNIQKQSDLSSEGSGKEKEKG